MSSQEQCNPPPDSTAPLDPRVSMFQQIALLQVPQPCRGPLHHLGTLLFNWSLETFGIANEESSSQAITARRLEALTEDLRSIGRQLNAIGHEPESSQVDRAELALCDAAGLLAPTVFQVAKKLERVVSRAES